MGLIAALSAAAFVSLNNVLTPQIYVHGGNPLTLLILRYVGLLLVIGAWVKSFERDVDVARTDFRICLVVGAVYAAAAAALLTAIAFLPVSLAILIFYIFPLLTLVIDSLLNREMPGGATLFATLTALFGLAIAMGVGPVVPNLPGILFAAVAAVFASLGLVISGRYLRHVKPVVMIYHNSKAGLITAIAIAILAGEAPQLGSTSIFWLVLVGGIAAFGAAYYLMFASVRLIGATRTSMILNLEPVFTAILSAVILQEYLSPVQMAGAMLVLLSVVAAQFWSHPESISQSVKPS